MQYEALCIAENRNRFSPLKVRPESRFANLCASIEKAIAEGEGGELPPLSGGSSKRLTAHRAKMGRDRNGCIIDTRSNGASRAQPKSTGGSSGFTQGDLERAKASARSSASDRWGKVFASPASRGRERVCSLLLAHKKGFSADAIVKQLADLPTDRELAARNAGQPSARGNNVMVTAMVPAGRATKEADQRATTIWDRAIAAVDLHGGLQPAPLASGKSADVWDKAIAKAFPNATKEG